MNEPRVVESVTNECQSLGRAHESSSARAEQLIACLEGEIAKRDVELERLRAKTRTTMGVGSGDGQLFIHGDYESVKAAQRIIIERDRLRAELSAAKETISRYETTAENCDLLRGELAALKEQYLELAALSPSSPLTIAAPVSEAKSQDTVGEVVGWYRLDRPYEMTPYPSVCATWHRLGAPVAPLYAAPVQQVSVPDVLREAIKWADHLCFECGALVQTRAPSVHVYNKTFEAVQAAKAMLAAAPAAPAADAGLVEALGYQVLFDAIAAATRVYANGSINISVQAFRESLAAHRAKGVV